MIILALSITDESGVAVCRPRSRTEFAALSTAHWRTLLAGPPATLAPWLQAGAESGDANAQTMLAQMALDGRGVRQDIARAYAGFSCAAEQSHPMAMNMRARCLEHGWGVSPDIDAAVFWYAKAAEAGLDWGMYNTANLLARGVGAVSCGGKGRPADHASALKWYRKAAALGHAKSLNLVGRYYEAGIVVEADRNAALRYYRASAEAGDFRGQYSYACMLAERGRVAPAVMWLKKIPETATVPFMRKIANDLLLSPHQEIRAIATSILDRRMQDSDRKKSLVNRWSYSVCNIRNGDSD